MATFGSTINPALGTIDYSPFLRGSMAGSQAMGQGLAEGISSIGQGIEKYKEQQKQNKQMEGEVKAGIQTLKGLLETEGISPNIVKAASPLLQMAMDPNVPLKQQSAAIRNGIQQFNTVYELGQQTVTQKMKERELAAQEQNALANLQQANASILAAKQPKGSSKAIDPVSVRSVGPNGEPVEVSVDRLTGQIIAQGPVTQPKYVRSKEEELDLMKERSKIEAEGAALAESMKKDAAYLEPITQRAINASDNINTNRLIRDLLAKPETQTGTGQEYITVLRAGAVRAGFKDAALADQQTLETFLKTDQLKQAQVLAEGQGAMSNYERQLFADTSLTSSKTKDSLIKILNLRDAVEMRALGAEQERQRLFDEGKSVREMAEGVRRWYSKNTISSFLNDIQNTSNDFSEADRIITGKK